MAMAPTNEDGTRTADVLEKSDGVREPQVVPIRPYSGSRSLDRGLLTSHDSNAEGSSVTTRKSQILLWLGGVLAAFVM
jgi:hypothetical protein